MTRGTVNTLARFKQQCRFDGLVYGTISPTDIDLFIDFGNRLFVLGEAKSGTAPFEGGQRLGFERLAQACRIPTVYLLARHAIPTIEDVLIADCDVCQVYRAPTWKWLPPSEPLTVRQQVDRLRAEFGLNDVKPRVFVLSVKPAEYDSVEAELAEERAAIQEEARPTYPPVERPLMDTDIDW